MARTTPELASLLQASAPQLPNDVWPFTRNRRFHGYSSESGFESGILLSQSQNLTTCPPAVRAFAGIESKYPTQYNYVYIGDKYVGCKDISH
ncbi:hypothetical protein AVEN_210424-1 [Araneus ventricosus]|uniref:Uncharacterized protein n=1 Tax=Araneus ventricosus TaxID=182803 RepID=A0A4Y2X3G2_ARAVE|nr:hypothetical protein AVEN_210424-1 [Araneus ventricosus]